MSNNELNDEPLNEDLIRAEDECAADVKELQKAFNKFSEKYGDNIAAFTLSRPHNFCWSLQVTIDNKLFDNALGVIIKKK